MNSKFLKIVLLAAVSDGEIQTEELEMLSQIKKSHPELKKISDEDSQIALADIYNKLSAGMETKHILEQLADSFTQMEKNAAFALAKEVCAADFRVMPAEKDFLELLVTVWGIPEDVVSAVDTSISLRYSIY